MPRKGQVTVIPAVKEQKGRKVAAKVPAAKEQKGGERTMQAIRSERARRGAAKRWTAEACEKRRMIDPVTTEIDYSKDEVEFMMAIQRYKEQYRRPFPTMKEHLEVLRGLGYRKLSPLELSEWESARAATN